MISAKAPQSKHQLQTTDDCNVKFYRLMRQRRSPRRGTALPVTSVALLRAGYGSTAEAAPLVGEKPPAKVGPTAQVPVAWLYSSE